MAQPTTALTEPAIRMALLAYLRGRLRNEDLLIEELGIEHGAARVDVAQVSDRLLGFEIKSDFDTLDRLARQMHAYHRVFDALSIVTTAAFLDQVEALLPKWWGILLVSDDGTALTLAEIRPASAHARQEAMSLAALLWRDEAHAFLLEEAGPVVRARATRHEIYEAIAAAVPAAKIRSRVLTALRTREVLRERSHTSGEHLAYREHQVVAGRVAPPCHEIA